MCVCLFFRLISFSELFLSVFEFVSSYELLSAISVGNSYCLFYATFFGCGFVLEMNGLRI